MKINTLLAALFVVVTSSLMAMEKGDKERLNFITNNDMCITGYSKQNMDFWVKPADFLGKPIFDVFQLSNKDRNAIIVGCCTAIEKKATVKVPYELDEISFIAKITALKIAHAKYNYFVKIKQLDDENK